MKTWILLLAAIPAAAGQTDFRKAAWGMTETQVQATEAAPPARVLQQNGEAVLQYDSLRLGGVEATAVYVFADNRLVRAKYLLTPEHAELNDFIRDFRQLGPLLVEKYGKPALDRAIWEDDSTQLEPKSYLDQDRATPASILPSDPNVGLAVSLGHLKLFTEWEGDRTRVLHSLTGQDHQITHQIEFRSVETSPKKKRP